MKNYTSVFRDLVSAAYDLTRHALNELLHFGPLPKITLLRYNESLDYNINRQGIAHCSML